MHEVSCGDSSSSQSLGLESMIGINHYSASINAATMPCVVFSGTEDALLVPDLTWLLSKFGWHLCLVSVSKDMMFVCMKSIQVFFYETPWRVCIRSLPRPTGIEIRKRAACACHTLLTRVTPTLSRRTLSLVVRVCRGPASHRFCDDIDGPKICIWHHFALIGAHSSREIILGGFPMSILPRMMPMSILVWCNFCACWCSQFERNNPRGHPPQELMRNMLMSSSSWAPEEHFPGRHFPEELLRIPRGAFSSGAPEKRCAAEMLRSIFWASFFPRVLRSSWGPFSRGAPQESLKEWSSGASSFDAIFRGRLQPEEDASTVIETNQYAYQQSNDTSYRFQLRWYDISQIPHEIIWIFLPQ